MDESTDLPLMWSDERWEAWDRLSWRRRIDNALWAYRVCPDKQEVLNLYAKEFARLNQMRRKMGKLPIDITNKT